MATHASDLAVAFVAETFYRGPDSTPKIETSLQQGDLIVAVSVPLVPGGAQSTYLKLRERASYEFALVSVAASVELDGGAISDARVALGGVGTRPWRARLTEIMLQGVPLDDSARLRQAAAAAFVDASPLRDNGFKIELGTRAIVRALRQAEASHDNANWPKLRSYRRPRQGDRRRALQRRGQVGRTASRRPRDLHHCRGSNRSD